MAARTENDQLTLAASYDNCQVFASRSIANVDHRSLVLSGAKEQILVELTRVLGRNVSVADQPLNFAAAILWCLKSVFSATNPFLGAFLLMVLTFGSITGGCYLVYSSLEDSGKSGYGITAKITTALGDGIEAFFLVLFDLIARNRPVIAVTGLSMAGVLRCTGKVFTNNINWSDGGILLEIVGEVGLCLLRWRLLLTEGRWGVNHEWKLVRSDEPVTVAEQVSGSGCGHSPTLFIG